MRRLRAQFYCRGAGLNAGDFYVAANGTGSGLSPTDPMSMAALQALGGAALSGKTVAGTGDFGTQTISVTGNASPITFIPRDPSNLPTIDELTVNPGTNVVFSQWNISSRLQSYDFSGTAGTKLSTLLDLILGDDCMTLSGAGLLNKATSVATLGLYASKGGGYLHQKVTAVQPAISTTLQLCVLGTNVGGSFTGYVWRKSSTTAARLTKFVAGTPTTLASPTITNTGTFEIEATVAADGSKVDFIMRENGAQIATFTDSTNPITIGRMGIAYTATSAQSGVYDSVTFFCDTPTGGTGVVQAKTLRLGYQTPANNGGVGAANPQLGFLKSGKVGFWEFELVSGDATAWPSYVAGSTTPAPIRALTSADAGTTAVYDVLIDGVKQPSSKRFTITIQPIIETTPALSVASQADVNRLTKASLGSTAVELVEGMGDGFTIGSEFPSVAQTTLNFSGFNTHTGRFTIQHAPGTSDYLKGGITFTGSANIDVPVLRVQDAVDAWNGSSSLHANFQSRALVTIATSSSIHINGGSIGSPASVLGDPTRWVNGISYTDSGDPLSQQTDMQIGNVAFRYVNNAISAGNLDSFHFHDYTIYDFCSNALFNGGAKATNGIVENARHLQRWFNPANAADHPDTLQNGSTSAKANYDTIVFRNIVVGLGTGNRIAQGPFFNDVGYNSAASGALLTNGQHLTGLAQNNITLENIIAADGSTVCFDLDLGGPWTLARCTAYRPPALADTADTFNDNKPRCDLLTESVGGAQHQSTGTITKCAFHDLAGIAGTGFTETDNVSFNAIKGGGFSGVGGSPSGGANEVARQAYYATFFGAANVQSDDPMIHARPLKGGPLMLADGTYAGALFPDGTWNDGSVYTGP